jgi:hypothetical protein
MATTCDDQSRLMGWGRRRPHRAVAAAGEGHQLRAASARSAALLDEPSTLRADAAARQNVDHFGHHGDDPLTEGATVGGVVGTLALLASSGDAQDACRRTTGEGVLDRVEGR